MRLLFLGKGVSSLPEELALTISRSHSQTFCMPQSVKYLESRKVDVRGIVDKTFKLEDFGQALDSIRNKECVKAAIVFD